MDNTPNNKYSPLEDGPTDSDQGASLQSAQQTSATTSASSRWFRIGLLVLAVLLAGLLIAAVVTKKHTSNSSNSSNNSATAGHPAVVNITGNDLNPQTIRVTKGQTVTWKNNDTVSHQIATDPYPQEDGLTGFVADAPALAGETYSFTFNKTGTYTYHDHLKPSELHGTVIVK
jgi:plastocyanin